MTETRQFHIGDIISAITGHLVSPRGIEGIYDILNWMTGDNLYTHALPRAQRECEPELRRQHPDLAAINVPDSIHDEASLRAWLTEITPVYGETRAVAPVSGVDHTVIDPLAELAMMRPDAPVIVVVPAPGEEV